MTTLSPENGNPGWPQAHRHRQVAESFGIDPERYDRTRPAYPEALVARILAGSPGPDLLDVGCGTGIAARQFRAAGARVLGVEPDERMAGYARRDGLDVEVATFENWEPAGRAFDAVVAATAWHWVDASAGAAKAGQVLRPDGRLAVFWHTFELPPEIATGFVEVFRQVVPDAPFAISAAGPSAAGYQPLFDRAADGIRQVPGFDEPEQWRFDWERTYTRQEWLDQLPTSGALTRLPADGLARVLDGVGAAIDAVGGSFPLAYATVAVTAVRLDPA